MITAPSTHPFFFKVIFKLIYLFFKIYFTFGCLGSLLLCTGFLQLWQEGATLGYAVWASH